jgi:rare lipoprotein A
VKLSSAKPIGDFRLIFARITMILIVLLAILLVSSCGHPKQARVDVPPPPPPPVPAAAEAPAESAPAANVPPRKEKSLPSKPDKTEEDTGADLAEPTVPAGTETIATETGMASWYGPPYHNRRGSNGEVYNMHAMTAAHRTYPLGSIVRVTNVKTGSSALVRITDRGPFIPGRVLDLSLAAARKVDVWQPGVAQVKVELLQSGASAESSGKWAVQIGGFPDENVANKLADRLTRRYHTAKVLRFASPAGDWWIRIRVLDDDHERAQKLAAETTTSEGAVFLVRLD